MSDPAQQSPTPPAAPTPPATPVAAIPSEQPQTWAPPGAPPFGAPAGTAPAAAAYAPPPGYAPPAGYAAVGGAASVPVAGAVAPAPGYYGAPTAAPAYGAPAYLQGAPTVTAPRRGLGLAALLLALGATVGTTLIAMLVAFGIATGEPGVLDVFDTDIDFDWSLLTPARGWVLLAEILFWVGTALGLWAIAQGIAAAVTGRGRATGIVAIAVAALGPVAFGLGVMFALVLGATAATV